MTLEIIAAPDLAGVRHGFFTRKGGASSGIFAGLNCGYGSSDLAEAVAINRARAAEAMEAPPEALVTLHQHHSAEVVHVICPDAAGTRADAMVTEVSGLALAVLTADCQPVLFADTAAGVVAAAHAGWRGTLAGVLEATLAAMESLGADRAHTSAVIGPAIGQDAYEVGPEFRDSFAADPWAKHFFRPGEGDRLHFDLPGYGRHRLRTAGAAAVSWTGHCTYSDPARFFSHRRSHHAGEADYGRLISCIRLSAS